MIQFVYCPLCGERLAGEYERGKKYPYCEKGHYTHFPSLAVGAASVVHKNGQVLLERRAIHPGYGQWGLPGGMSEQGESIEETLRREIFEETGLKVKSCRLLNVSNGKRICTIFFEVEVHDGDIVKSDESFEVRWFRFGDIPFDDFAFPVHREILQDWLKTVRYSNIS